MTDYIRERNRVQDPHIAVNSLVLLTVLTLVCALTNMPLHTHTHRVYRFYWSYLASRAGKKLGSANILSIHLLLSYNS